MKPAAKIRGEKTRFLTVTLWLQFKRKSLDKSSQVFLPISPEVFCVDPC